MGDRMQGRVGLITGGASGIGLAIAERAVAEGAEGARVVLSDLDAALLAEREKVLGEAVASIAMDIRDEARNQAMVSLAVERFGRLDWAVNSAGVGAFAPIVDQTEAQWDAVVDVCLKGLFLSMKHEAKRMQAQGEGGVIVNIASLNAYQPAEGMSAYCSAKAAVEMLTRVGAMELGRDRIRVCGLAPGLVDTPLTAQISAIPGVRDEYLENIPLGRAGTVDDIASAALFLLSGDASWVSGTTLS
ncbi:MAG: SDR family oxidoreductase, partial [Deltaproteobacteria bacterium]|nr:SDR family oxidoreductase [Deltaproteobacteria bacterium]